MALVSLLALGAPIESSTARNVLFASMAKFPPPSPPTGSLSCPEDVGSSYGVEINKLYKAGQSDVCPAESFYWKHHPDIFMGYEGCVGENFLIPCPQDGYGGLEGSTEYNKSYVYNEETGLCEETGYTIEDTSFWVRSGHPMDKHELVKRTGLDISITFPFIRAPYPSYSYGGSHGADDADLWPTQKDWLVYLGGFTSEGLQEFGAYPTEGAEQSMDLLLAGKALELASTTCTRTMYVLIEVPGYGYDVAQAARWTNTQSGRYYNSTVCTCFPNCFDKTVEIVMVGWAPGTDYPIREGGDGKMYEADSTDPNSPWIESMVFPENPTGVIKSTNLPVHRRICDGVYDYPMYFGHTNWVVPLDKLPDCSGWAYSITKVYSAAFRAGVVSYKKDQPIFAEMLALMTSRAHSGANGLYSDMVWMGYIQFMNLAMASGPVTSPTSFIGAYVSIQDEKWTALTEAQENCPFMEVVNPYAGAYSWWRAKGELMSGDDDFNLYDYFWYGFGVEARPGSGYFRGVDPVDVYGPGYTLDDFVRMQLYRDVNVYLEIARRMKLACDGGAAEGFLSLAEYNAMSARRRLQGIEGTRSHDERFDNIKAAAPRLSDSEAHRLAFGAVRRELLDNKVEAECAAEQFAEQCKMRVTDDGPEDLRLKPSKEAYYAKKKKRQQRRLSMSAAQKKRILAQHTRHTRKQLQEESDFDEVTLDKCAMKGAKGGSFEVCPPETFYWEHHPSVYGGYTGCVGENGLIPCAQNGYGGLSASLSRKKPYYYNMTTGVCEETGYDVKEEIFWILWGHPMDKFELLKRTGLDPVIKFPFVRGPYPSEVTESADLWPTMKDWLVYLGAHSYNQLLAFDGLVTEGAEQGMDILFAAKALEYARQCCVRHFYVLTEAPAYSYDFAQAARWANIYASSFFSDPTCTCAADDSCNSPNIQFTLVGWFPGTDLPSAEGGDGEIYSATSTATHSPWLETMVMPENPSGTIKTPQLSMPRRVCDGVYVYPMYFGHRNWRVPTDEMPDCSGWAYSITKVYSASFRAGLVSYKIDQEAFGSAMNTIVNRVHSGANGQGSDMAWKGYIQFMQMAIASGPVSSPTSWIGAYVEIQKEKWSALIEAQEGCPFLEVTNPNGGAYSFWKAKGEGLGLHIVEFFAEGFGVTATDYSFGFRGADPADFYGPGVTVRDFTRLQLYRDFNIYHEVARRMKIACEGGAAEGFLSFEEFKMSKARRRRLSVADNNYAGHVQDIKAVTRGRLTDEQVNRIAETRAALVDDDRKLKECEPENYATTCLMNIMHKPEFAA